VDSLSEQAKLRCGIRERKFVDPGFAAFMIQNPVLVREDPETDAVALAGKVLTGAMASTSDVVPASALRDLTRLIG
jgi:hypothetical protein